MGIIQNAIKQTLQTAGNIARLNPNFDTNVKLGKLKAKEKTVDLQQQAMEKVAQKQIAQLKQQESFKKYIGNLETNLGLKVGELPGHVQTLIIEQMKEDKKKDVK